MLKIRLQRTGKKSQPVFRVVLIPSRRSGKGKALEVLGWWSPLLKQGSFNKERINYFLKNGAKPSPTLWNLLVKNKIVEGKKLAIKISKAKNKAEQSEAKQGAVIQSQTEAKT